MRRRGLEVTFDETLPFLGLKSLLMGFTWAVYLAQIPLEDIFEFPGRWLGADNRLGYGERVPQLIPQKPVH